MDSQILMQNFELSTSAIKKHDKYRSPDIPAQEKLTEIYPNMGIALRISATLPVTVAAAERSFSKLKLIKNYLRSTMVQERLGGLSVISINHVVSQLLSYNDIRDDFAARKARRDRL